VLGQISRESFHSLFLLVALVILAHLKPSTPGPSLPADQQSKLLSFPPGLRHMIFWTILVRRWGESMGVFCVLSTDGVCGFLGRCASISEEDWLRPYFSVAEQGG
jgi:hypothetical protein